VGDTGIEPVTSSVSGKRATAAPIAQTSLGYNQEARWRRDSNPCRRLCRPLPRLSATPPCWYLTSVLLHFRADDEIRTRDPHLGKVMRYHCATSALHLFGAGSTLADGRGVLKPPETVCCPGPFARDTRRGDGSGPLSFVAQWPGRAIGAAVARFLHTEEVTGSIPVSPTSRLLMAELRVPLRPSFPAPDNDRVQVPWLFGCPGALR
jgi:hypothetical protein